MYRCRFFEHSENTAFKEKWVLNVTIVKVTFAADRNKNGHKVKKYSVFLVSKNLCLECTAAELHRISADDFSRSRTALSLECCQALENTWCLKKPNKVKGKSFGSIVTESEVSGNSPHPCE